ncbi:FAD-dependent monooxygenase [Kitasatospora sp. NPDC057692]|uniref:FAD-dependent monooxygenase n=1 Tax=Kitasatospora sp. NPDC057692 TaxID=3346215 RepID=UPI00369AFF29
MSWWWGPGRPAARPRRPWPNWGCAHTVITERRCTADTPRAHVVSQRTLEVLRDPGVEAEVRAAAVPLGSLPDAVYRTSLAGEELGRVRTWGSHPEHAADYRTAGRLGIEIATSTIGPGHPYQDPYGDWARLCGTAEDGCVLVRPDTHVAFRSPALPADPADALTRALAAVLSRPVLSRPGL